MSCSVWILHGALADVCSAHLHVSIGCRLTPLALCRLQKLDQNTLVPIELCGEQWVLFRDERGQPSCIKDQCAHRACPLSAGQVVNGQVECPYHG